MQSINHNEWLPTIGFLQSKTGTWVHEHADLFTKRDFGRSRNGFGRGTWIVSLQWAPFGTELRVSHRGRLCPVAYSFKVQ
jgi:hypothetical protein